MLIHAIQTHEILNKLLAVYPEITVSVCKKAVWHFE